LKEVRNWEEANFSRAALAEGFAVAIAKGFVGIFARAYAEGYAQVQAEEMLKVAKKLLAMIGRRRFGEPGPGMVDRIEALFDREIVESLVEESFSATNGDELLATGRAGA